MPCGDVLMVTQYLGTTLDRPAWCIQTDNVDTNPDIAWLVPPPDCVHQNDILEMSDEDAPREVWLVISGADLPDDIVVEVAKFQLLKGI